MGEFFFILIFLGCGMWNLGLLLFMLCILICIDVGFDFGLRFKNVYKEKIKENGLRLFFSCEEYIWILVVI